MKPRQGRYVQRVLLLGVHGFYVVDVLRGRSVSFCCLSLAAWPQGSYKWKFCEERRLSRRARAPSASTITDARAGTLREPCGGSVECEMILLSCGLGGI